MDTEGVVIKAYVNANNLIVVPGTHHSFDGLNYENVIVGLGEFRCILPLPQGFSVQDLVTKYGTDNFILLINQFENFGHEPCILVGHVDKDSRFNVNLHEQGTFKLKNLVFHLTPEEVQEFVTLSPLNLSSEYKERLQNYLSTNPQQQTRRINAAIGPNFLENKISWVLDGNHFFALSKEDTEVRSDIEAALAEGYTLFSSSPQFNSVVPDESGNFSYARLITEIEIF